MRASHRRKLADWLILQAQREDASAKALAKMAEANPAPAAVRARLFREIAEYLYSLPPEDEDGRDKGPV